MQKRALWEHQRGALGWLNCVSHSAFGAERRPERRESNSHNKRLPLNTRIMTNKILFCTNANLIPFHFQNTRFYQRPRYSGAFIFRLNFDLSIFINNFIILFLNYGNLKRDIEEINNRNKRLIQ